MYGQVEYNEEGLPMCEICGQHFDRILTHARIKHDISAKDYKQSFGLDVKKGICSQRSRELSRERVMENYDKVVKENLIANGVKTRFYKGGKGRTIDKVSFQTMLRLKQQSFIKKGSRS
jgi:hypothetical protein